MRVLGVAMSVTDLNLERLRELYETGLDVEEDLIGFLISDYKGMLASAVSKFNDNITNKDRRNMEILSHSLKSNSANLGLNQQLTYFLELEDISKAGDFEQFSLRLKDFESVHSKALELIETIQRQNYVLLKKAA